MAAPNPQTSDVYYKPALFSEIWLLPWRSTRDSAGTEWPEPADVTAGVKLSVDSNGRLVLASALDAKATAIPLTDEEAATLQRVVQAMRWADYHPGYAAFAEAVMDMPSEAPTPPPLADAG